MIDIDVMMPRLFTEGTRDLQVKLTIQPGSLTALIGPSGSGKTTLLRLLAGLETPSQGHITVDDVTWLDKKKGINYPPQKRSIGYVFQDTALFPNMTVLENIQFATSKDQQAFVNELIEKTGLAAFSHVKPDALSGGQRQRVALARALVRRPKLLLLDEPFAALDTDSSQLLRQVLLELHQAWGTTTLLVSHHEADVKALADRVIRLVQGRVQKDELRVSRKSALSIEETITRIQYDESQKVWVIDTQSTQLRSTNSAWEKLRVGDLMQVSNLPN
ncbi:sulfate/molybdate ABC transporter ATP-binding protein [Spirosoma pollinicola]|uniref:ABC transporter n=1 Tax=Spirosoma pollinicola TaxID=2057025 RepID=A0A2K8YVS9_9BACT|nr:ATP-binding cassette domain-containing protein [Spirosoma pollinicola]AUD01755.1 ABC transporter [Spirosoma pollinicola]